MTATPGESPPGYKIGRHCDYLLIAPSPLGERQIALRLNGTEKNLTNIQHYILCQGVNPLLTKGTKLMKRKQKIKQIHKNIFPKVGYMLIDVGAE